MKRAVLIAIFPLLLLALAYTALRYVAAVIASPTKATSIALMIDELANVDVNGQVEQTISTRAARAQLRGRRWGCLLCGILDKLDPGHCARALK